MFQQGEVLTLLLILCPCVIAPLFAGSRRRSIGYSRWSGCADMHVCVRGAVCKHLEARAAMVRVIVSMEITVVGCFLGAAVRFSRYRRRWR